MINRPHIFRNASFILPYEEDKVMTVHKVMRCCLLLRMEFLREISYFDRTTFLYEEKLILSVQVRQKYGKIVFTLLIEAIHAHVRSEKGNSSKRMLLSIKSRRYYLKKYNGYSQLELVLVNASYSLLQLLHYIKSKVSK